MIHLDHRDSRPIYDQIADNFRRQIRAGVLRCGDKLPSVRELSAQLTINPNTIQRSYGILEQEGWIVCVPGKGNFVGAIPAIADAQQTKLWNELTDLCAQMERAGISRDEIIRRLMKGGNENA